ncbi:hypothetical protein A2397_03860 [Candidatus Amesbacteria bacterium RIFOXYB1_FULL_44_23]|uniref:TrbC/VIRB2 family protein n=1 Tax=Candidatus Amesbacteria bacterium RIFOXYB1_FULL_44_23 TaxID=1797263 RepID=A0A1F4ZUU3_9BACT|nr:MAG: hypothetical protein A2397_03860 [Candidatus Amesbacteria bacterium RIFOXYB1_FULL_44_23]
MARHLKFLSALVVVLFFPVSALAQSANPASPATFQNINDLVTNLLNVFLGFVAIAGLVMLVVGGFIYLSAGDDKARTQSAQKTITYSLGGLILALSSWILLRLIAVFLGIDIGLFDICMTPSCA